jgi:glycosyltransferase involved in cell wall biosynthesis
MPKISVVMSAYNHAPFVANAISSVLDQSFRDFELLIRDDGSTDGTVDVIRGFDDPRIVFLGSGPNLGSALRRNELIAASRGEYIAFQNSDDVWRADKLAHQLAIMESRGELAATFGLATFIGPDGAARDCPAVFSADNRSQGQWLRRFLEAGNCLCHPSAMVRAACHASAGVYDPRYRQLPDMDMWVRLIKRHPIHVSDRVLLSFRIAEGAISFPNPETEARALNEQALIADTMLDDAPHDLLRDGFGDLMVFRDPPSETHWEIERALIYLSVLGGANFSYALIGLRRLYGLWASARHQEVLRADYGIDHHTLHGISAKAAAFAHIARLTQEVARQNEAYRSLQNQATEIASARESLATRYWSLDETARRHERTIAQLQAERDELALSRDALAAERAELQALAGRQGETIAALTASRSWRITRPLRYLAERAKQWRGK